jgi:hypothetical protein
MTIKTSFDLYIELVETPLHLVPAEDDEIEPLFDLGEEDVDAMYRSFSHDDDSSVDSFSSSSDDDDDDDDDEEDDEKYLLSELSRFFSESAHSQRASSTSRMQNHRHHQSRPRETSSSASSDEDSITLASRRGVRRLERGDSLVLARGRVRPLQGDRSTVTTSTTTSNNTSMEEDDFGDYDDDHQVVILPLNDGLGNGESLRTTTTTMNAVEWSYTIPLNVVGDEDDDDEEVERFVPLAPAPQSHSISNNSSNNEDNKVGGQQPRRRRGPRDSILRRYPSSKTLREEMGM